MDTYDDCDSGRLCDTAGEGRSVAALIAIMTLVFIAYFGLRVAVPELPLHVYQALVSLPS